MKLLIFDWKGRMGHFRKLDTNSSSLTYIFPSRTAIAGMIAGVLGYEKDSYYDLFSPDKCRIALSMKTPVRKLFQTVNYLYVKTKGDLNGVNGHTQIPIEFLFPSVLNDQIVYRLYFWHNDQSIFNKLKNHLIEKTSVYPPYMGLSELLSTLEFVQEGVGQENVQTGEKVKFDSVIRISDIKENSLELLPSTRFSKEFMTRFFNQNREIVETDNYIVEQQNQLVAVPKTSYYQVIYNGICENILFM